MAALGYEIKGECGMLFRRYLKKIAANSHVYEKGSGEIDRCIKFRDWMYTHKADQDKYAQLKQALAEKNPHDILSYYVGKDAFKERQFVLLPLMKISEIKASEGGF